MKRKRYSKLSTLQLERMTKLIDQKSVEGLMIEEEISVDKNWTQVKRKIIFGEEVREYMNYDKFISELNKRNYRKYKSL